MSDKDTARTSKFLALVLRHQPDVLGIRLDAAGWTDVNELLKRMNDAGRPITLDELKHVVATNNKKRFAFDETGMRIRASQGHSVEVELGYEPTPPPDVLYHGTSEHRLLSILEVGIDKRQRHHVHLYADASLAKRVGMRHGKPIVLQVNAKKMHEDGLVFYISANGVWLTDYVAPHYIGVLQNQA